MEQNPSSSFSEMEGSTFAVSDYLQLAAMSLRSVQLELSRNGMRIGEICILKGELHTVTDDKGSGAAAFSRLAFAEDLKVSCVPVGEVPPPKNIRGSIEQLLIEAARSSDEEVRDRGNGSGTRVLDNEGEDDLLQIIDLTDRRSPPPPPRPPHVQSRPISPSPPLLAVPNDSVTDPPPSKLHSEPEGRSMPREHRPPPPRQAPATPVLQSLLAIAPGLHGAMISSYDGQVLTQAGEFDAETAAAVIATAVQTIWKACAEIGFGSPSNWSMTIGKESWYVCQHEREVIVVVGAAVDNPETTMRKVVAALPGDR